MTFTELRIAAENAVNAFERGSQTATKAQEAIKTLSDFADSNEQSLTDTERKQVKILQEKFSDIAANRADTAERERDAAQNELTETEKERDTAQNQLEETEKELTETEAERNAAQAEVDERRLRDSINAYHGFVNPGAIEPTDSTDVTFTPSGTAINASTSDYLEIPTPTPVHSLKLSSDLEDQASDRWNTFTGTDTFRRLEYEAKLRSRKITKGNRISAEANFITDATDHTQYTIPNITNLPKFGNIPSYTQLSGTKIVAHGGDSTLTDGDGINLGRDTDDNGETDDFDRRFQIGGTYKGVPGTFMCSVSSPTGTCTYTTTNADDPNLSGITLGGEWSFKPGNRNQRITIDPAYISYGWWMTEAEAGTKAIRAFNLIEINQAAPVTSINVNVGGATGEATYVGTAIGQYAVRDRQLGSGIGTGDFTARASLTANFGSNNQISGTIDNFQLTGGSNGSGWNVRLNQTSLENNGRFGGTTATTRWYINGNAEGDTGKYEGVLLHKPTEDEYPLHGVGVFYSQYGRRDNDTTGARMVGAFGVDCTHTDCTPVNR